VIRSLGARAKVLQQFPVTRVGQRWSEGDLMIVGLCATLQAYYVTVLCTVCRISSSIGGHNWRTLQRSLPAIAELLVSNTICQQGHTLPFITPIAVVWTWFGSCLLCTLQTHLHQRTDDGDNDKDQNLKVAAATGRHLAVCSRRRHRWTDEFCHPA